MSEGKTIYIYISSEESAGCEFGRDLTFHKELKLMNKTEAGVSVHC